MILDLFLERWNATSSNSNILARATRVLLAYQKDAVEEAESEHEEIDETPLMN